MCVIVYVRVGTVTRGVLSLWRSRMKWWVWWNSGCNLGTNTHTHTHTGTYMCTGAGYNQVSFLVGTGIRRDRDMMQTTLLHLAPRLRMHEAVPSSSPMFLLGLLLSQEQGHQCNVHYHRSQVSEFGKSVGGCEFLFVPSGGVQSPLFLGLPP